MARLLYYEIEKLENKEVYDKNLSETRAEIILKKLLRHYKLGNPSVYWTSGRNQ